jgi:RNA-directed DNA polymerase
MRLRGYQLTRYADDWVIACKWAAETRSAVNAAHRILKQLGVELHPQKTRIAHVQHGFEFLGYKIKRGEKNFLCPRATGMRVSELLALQWADIDFERRLIDIRRTFYRGSFGLPKTSTSERVNPMSDGLHFALRQHKRNVRKSALALVFPNAMACLSEAANLLKRMLHPALAKCGLPRTGWRVFRRSVATGSARCESP